jgi:hypothetical protein
MGMVQTKTNNGNSGKLKTIMGTGILKTTIGTVAY